MVSWYREVLAAETGGLQNLNEKIIVKVWRGEGKGEHCSLNSYSLVYTNLSYQISKWSSVPSCYITMKSTWNMILENCE